MNWVVLVYMYFLLLSSINIFAGLFVDVGNNYSVLDNPNICFVYEYVGSKDSEREQSQFVSNCYCYLNVSTTEDFNS